MDWKSFEEAVRVAAVKALQELKSKCSGEQFYAYALYTDSSAMTVALATNSIEALHLKVEQEAEEEEEWEELRRYYKWAVSEWQYEGWCGEYFKDACKALREADERVDILSFQEKLYSTMVSVLGSLRSDGTFQGLRIQEPILFVSITDDDVAENVENETAKYLNSPAAYQAFVNRFDG